NLTGYNSKISKRMLVGDAAISLVGGAGLRYDDINPSELDHTQKALFINHLQFGKTSEINTNSYLDGTIEAGKWLLNTGIRVDYFHFYYLNLAPVTDIFASPNLKNINPNSQKAIISPKLN